ncbi:MAG TPA: condensation domain-containing protein [Gemmatimonadales bacterium]|nr:condensation domain-containing protein [Gemmatimonadales bacterium]
MPANRTLTLQRRAGSRRAVPRRPAGQVIPLSFGQELIWLHGQLAPDIPLYTESLTIHRRGPLDVDALIRSFREIVRRHEIWRTTFEWSQGQVIQRVHADNGPPVHVVDLRHLAERAREPAALELAADDLRRPLDLTREFGVRARLVTLSEHDHRLYLALHHMVFDGVSIYRAMLSELAALYDGEVSRTPAVLEEPPLQYGDYACWERQSQDDAALAPLVDYWRKQLAGAPRLIDLPTDRPRPRRQSFRGGLVRFTVPSDVTAAVRTTALQENCTLFMLLFAGYAATLHRWSGQTDMLIGSISAGRDHPELERLIGYFMRMLVLRVDLGGNPTFRELLGRVRDVLLDALCHDRLPVQRLVRAVTRERDLSCSPLFQVTLSIEPPKPGVDPRWDITELDAGATVSKFDLSVELEDRGDVIIGRAIYALDLFDAASIAELVSDWISLLATAAADPGQRLQDLAPAARAGVVLTHEKE